MQKLENAFFIVFLAAFCLPVWAVDEGGSLSATVHLCKQPEYKDKVVTIGANTSHPRQVDCKEWNRKREPDSADIYSCDYDSPDKFCRSLYGSGPGDTRVNAIIDNSLPFKNGNAALTCMIQGPGFYDVQYKTKFYFHKGCDKPKPDDKKPDDDKKPKPDDDKKPKPDDGNNPDKSMEDLLRRINDSLDRLNKNIEKSGSGSGGSGNGGGGHGSGNGGSGNGGGGHGSGGSGGGNGSGSGNGNGNGNGDHSGDGYSPPKDPDWGRLGGVKAPRYSKDGRFSESGFCPQPVVFNLTVLRRSQTFAFSYEHVCDLAVRMRPILIACAYFAAGLICLAALER